TVLLNDEVRDKVHESLTWFGQGNLWSEKLSRVKSSVKTFVELRNQPQDNTQNSTTPSFQLICSDGSARGWTKDINKFTASLLKPSANEAWFCLDLIDIKKISQIKLPEKKDDLMIEQKLISFLGDLSIPGKMYVERWSSVISSSLLLTSRDLSASPSDLNSVLMDDAASHILIIETLQNCKASLPKDDKTKSKGGVNMLPLYKLHNVIIKMFITYAIIRSANVSEAKDEEPSTAVVEQRKSLDKLRQRHNYLPFCMFMVAGVRGIILAPKDHCHLKGSDSLGILESLNIIYKSSTNHQRVEEVYWKELGKYINKLFYKTFHTSGSMFNFQQPLTLELAKAVATVFLNSWHQTVPNKVFEIPCAL
ncbi:hypothetical protein BY996DRAFT_4560745, partial [Phakopsora pachyrhizi]